MEEVKEDQYIKDILVKIQVIDPEAFERFASEHSICCTNFRYGVKAKAFHH